MQRKLRGYVRGAFMGSSVEHCGNPWNGKCKKTEIQLYIFYKGRQVPICRECWRDIADKDLEW